METCLPIQVVSSWLPAATAPSHTFHLHAGLAEVLIMNVIAPAHCKCQASATLVYMPLCRRASSDADAGQWRVLQAALVAQHCCA